VADSELISADEAVKVFEVGKSTLFGWMKEGKVKRYRRHGDRRTFVNRVELARFVAWRIQSAE
jgi:predicted site-specific integrase-resolvase